MSDLNIVIPIKNPDGAKERLAALLTTEQRRELAYALIDQTLDFFKPYRSRANILIVTDSERIASRARESGYDVLLEEKAEGETSAVNRATRWSMEKGFRSQVVIPGDMAGIDPEDMERLLSHPRPDPSVILCPAVGDDGTNAILTTPPDAIPFRFGVRSFPDYRARVEERGIPCEILRLRSMLLDLDTPDDLRAFLSNGSSPRIKDLLISWNILSAS